MADFNEDLPSTNISFTSNERLTTRQDSSSPETTPFESLISTDGWNWNILDQYQQVAYHIRFFMTEDSDWESTSFSSYEAMYQKIMNLNQTTIAESGVTGINISSLIVDTTIGPNPKYRSFSPTNFNMTINEPMGVSFMDMIASSVKELGIRNFAKFYYFLEISFVGYDENGGFVHNACSTFHNNGKWLYRVCITDMQIETASSGSIYNLTLKPYELRILDQNHQKIPDMISPVGSTVGEMLANIEKSLNESIYLMYGYQPRKYKFELSPFEFNGISYDLTKEKLTPESTDLNSKRSNSMEVLNGETKAHFNRGTDLGDIVDQIFANCEAAQKLAKDVMKIDDIKVEAQKFREVIVLRSHPTVKVVDYDYASEDYMLEYTIHIKPHYSQNVILEPNQITVSKDPNVQAENVLKLRKQNFLSKRYDYIFTGYNTQIINIDLKYSLNWAAALPRVMGFRNSNESNVPHDRINPKENIQKKYQELVNLHKQKYNIQTQIDENVTELNELKSSSNLSSRDRARMQEITENITDLQAEKQGIATRQKFIGEDVSEAREIYQREQRIERQSTILSSRERVRYAEDIRNDSLISERKTVPISLEQDSADSRFLMSGAFPDFYHRDRAIYGSVMDQLYSPMSTQLSQLNMDIKGDPYWLGSGNLETGFYLSQTFAQRGEVSKQTANQNSVDSPDYSRGDFMFLMTYKYPRGFADDGSPDIKMNDFFTGVYVAKKIIHKFENGQFTQSVESFRQPLIDVFKAFGYREEKITKEDKQ